MGQRCSAAGGARWTGEARVTGRRRGDGIGEEARWTGEATAVERRGNGDRGPRNGARSRF